MSRTTNYSLMHRVMQWSCILLSIAENLRFLSLLLFQRGELLLKALRRRVRHSLDNAKIASHLPKSCQLCADCCLTSLELFKKIIKYRPPAGSSTSWLANGRLGNFFLDQSFFSGGLLAAGGLGWGRKNRMSRTHVPSGQGKNEWGQSWGSESTCLDNYFREVGRSIH